MVESLKQNKSPGIDGVLNEHIKSTVNIMLPIYVKLFNIVFDTGLIPESWPTGNILPIYEKEKDFPLQTIFFLWLIPESWPTGNILPIYEKEKDFPLQTIFLL